MRGKTLFNLLLKSGDLLPRPKLHSCRVGTRMWSMKITQNGVGMLDACTKLSMVNSVISRNQLHHVNECYAASLKIAWTRFAHSVRSSVSGWQIVDHCNRFFEKTGSVLPKYHRKPSFFVRDESSGVKLSCQKDHGSILRLSSAQ